MPLQSHVEPSQLTDGLHGIESYESSSCFWLISFWHYGWLPSAAGEVECLGTPHSDSEEPEGLVEGEQQDVPSIQASMELLLVLELVQE